MVKKYVKNMEKTHKQKEQLLEDLWYKRNPCHDNDQEGNDRFWGTVLCVFNDYQKALKQDTFHLMDKRELDIDN